MPPVIARTSPKNSGPMRSAMPDAREAETPPLHVAPRRGRQDDKRSAGTPHRRTSKAANSPVGVSHVTSARSTAAFG